ncbi:MAG TPA: hypothetical protein VID26_01990 [Candidatus Limnocylindrales bacterium]|jgi:hypothetical protein
MEPTYAQATREGLRWLPNRAALLIAAVIAAQLLDLATFVPAVARVGIGAESNPLARSLYLLQGPFGPALLKGAAISVMLLALLRVQRRFPNLVLPSAVILVAIGLVGAASNLLFGLAT